MDETQHQFLIIGNELDSDGWALIAPYGEWPKSRVARVNGIPTEQKFLQVLDNAGADKLMDKESGLFRSLKRALVGIPFYLGHPDLAEHSPETLAAAGRKQDAGVVDKLRKGERGIEAHFVLNQVGATAVENGTKFPSALWMVLPNGETKNGAAVCHPFKLLSVGLTDRPNISGVESLANARGAETQTQQEPDMKLIAGWLLAQGVALANVNEPTEAQVLEAFQKLHTAKAGEVVTLGNEKTTLAGQITTLTNERDTLKNQVTTLTTAKTTAETALANEQTARKAERKARAEAIVDLAVTKGKLKLADRAAKITVLENTADEAAFKTAADGLLNGANVVKTIGGGNAQSGKVLANDGTDPDAAVDPRDAFMEAVKKHQNDTGETDLGKAMKAVKTQCPQLHQALLGRNPETGKPKN